MKIYNTVAALLIAIALTSCTQNQSSGSDEHAHDESLRLTAYNADFEIFAEAQPFVVGKESTILAHFSHLANFKALTGGSITVSLIVGTEGIRQTVEKPIQDGIYLFAVKPSQIGIGKLIFDIKTPEGTSQITVPNIKIFDDEDTAQHDAIDAVVSSNNGVLFTKEQSWKVDFATDEARREPFGQVIKATAQIQPSQIDENVIVAKASGIVKFSSDNIVEGKAVGSGQTLFSLNSSGLADNNLDVRYSEALSEYNRAKADYERKKELIKDRIVSQRELTDAETAYKNAEAVYNNLNRNFSSGRQAISSPINGFIKQVLVRNGEYAEAGQPVLVVSQNRDLLIKAELQPKFFDALGTIQSANIRVMNSNLSYTLEDLKGKVISYGKSTDLSNPLIPVVFQVQNSIGLLPGSFVEMYIKLQTNNYALTIPNESIVEEMGSYFVYVQITPEFFEKRAVSIGKNDGFRTEITEGISQGERVVSKGAILVKLSQATGSLDTHGHAH